MKPAPVLTEADPGAETLREVLSLGGPELASVMTELESRMRKIAASHGTPLSDPAEATIAAGGKRLRPLLVCLAAGVPPSRSPQLLASAVAVELVHAATLVHDDVLDGAALRRGQPTVVATEGRRAATATGDLLFSRAFSELSAAGSVAAVQVLSRASSQLAQGELMQRADSWALDITPERYLERCRLKTGVLFRAACELGALAGGADAGGLGDFGERIGIAFQILDDVLDVSGPSSRTGKDRGTDLLDGTVTLPLLEARARDPQLAQLDLRSISGPAQAEQVCEAIAVTGALEISRQRALATVEQATSVLGPLPAAQRKALGLVADGVVLRYA